MFQIKGKVAIITSGAKGLGLCYAEVLLEYGLKGVALIDIDEINGLETEDRLKKRFGQEHVIFIKADITDRIHFEGIKNPHLVRVVAVGSGASLFSSKTFHCNSEAFEATVKYFKQLDIVINNAGIIQELKWEESIAVNLTAVITGSMLAMNKYLPKYRDGHEGLIVNIASLLGVQPAEELTVYGAAKHGVVGLSRGLGGPIHYQESKVKVITLCPGMTDTEKPMTNIGSDVADEPYRSIIVNLPKNFECQKASDLAKNLIHIMEEGESGSVWAAVKNSCFQVEFPYIPE